MLRVFSLALGNIWRWCNSPNRNSLLDHIRTLDISGVELTFPTKEELFFFHLSDSNRQWLLNLDYVTIHAPFRLYEDSRNEREVIEQINKISELIRDIDGKNVIIHPEMKLFESDLLNEFEFQISIENLPKKNSFPISDLQEVFHKYPGMKLCLDVSHAYSWSKFETSKLIEAFQDRISQIHFSGSYRKKDHQSLKNISNAFRFSIRPVHQLKVPIVIEEDMEIDSLDNLREEVEYIKTIFSTYNSI